MRFLFMEDDIPLARLVQKNLERLGYQVDLAVDGRTGLDMCHQTRYDLVIVDQKMPVLSGLEVIEALNGFSQPPPVIMVTGAGDENTAVRALKLGARDYIVKETTGYLELLHPVIEQTLQQIELQREREQALHALAESEKRFRSLVELLPDALLVLKKGKVVFLNGAGKRLLERVEAPHDDLFLKDFIHPDSLSFFEGTVAALQENGTDDPEPARFETRVLTRSGTGITVEAMCSAIEFEGLPAIQLVARDISFRKRAEEEISHMNDELEQLVEDQNEQLNVLHKEMEAASRKLNAAQMATGALHNVKNVLNSLIVGTSMMGRILSDSKIGRVAKVAQLLRDNQSQLGTFLSEGERGRFLPDFLTTLSQSLEREHDMIYKELQGLTKNLEHIKFSIQLQLSSTRLSESGEFLDLEDVVEDALKVNANTLNRNQVRIRREGEGLPMLPGNRHKVLQILVNLISNAIHALEAVKDREPTITISMETKDTSTVSITVTDNGIGISRDHLDNIFSYGFTTRRGGHGLGLHSCLQLAAEMGGNLTAHSDGRGKGSAFTLNLPVPSAEEE